MARSMTDGDWRWVGVHYQVRFNLESGPDKNKWEVSLWSRGKELRKCFDRVYLDPENVTLVLEDARLVNIESKAKSVYEGRRGKHRFSWVECKSFAVTSHREVVGERVSYNPCKVPFWTLKGKKSDGKRFRVLKTSNRAVIQPSAQGGDR